MASEGAALYGALVAERMEHPAGIFSLRVAEGWSGGLDDAGALRLACVGRLGELWLHAFPLEDEEDVDDEEEGDEPEDEVELPGIALEPPPEAEPPRESSEIDFSAMLGLDAWKGEPSDTGQLEAFESEVADDASSSLMNDAASLLGRWATDADIEPSGPVQRAHWGTVDVAWFDGQSRDAETGALETGRYWVLVRGPVVACAAHTWPRAGDVPAPSERTEVETMLGSLVLRPPAAVPLDGFAALVADAINEARPDLNARATPHGVVLLEGVDGHVQLENQWRQCGGHPDAIEHLAQAIVESIASSLDEARAAPPFEFVKPHLRPLLKTEEFLRSAPMALVSRPFMGTLIVCYVVDAPRTVRYVTRDWLASWALDEEALHRAAIDNLEAATRELPMQAAGRADGRVELLCYETQDGYDASRILLPDLLERLREHLGPTYLVGVPNRDFFIAFRDEPDLVAHCRTVVAEHARTMPYPLCDGLLRVVRDGVAPA